MRKFTCLIIAVILLFSLSVPSFASSSAQSIQYFSNISTDGSCQVSINLTINLEGKRSDLNFPVPSEATNVTVNGTSTRVFTEYGVHMVSLNHAVAGFIGSVSVNINYRIPNVLLKNDKELFFIDLPILSGFSLPIDYFEFQITLPADVEFHPNFSDTYLQETMETILSYSVTNSTISGVALEPLKDHDSVNLSLQINPDDYPNSLYLKNISPWTQVAMMICSGIAILYWLIFLRSFPVLPQKNTSVPNSLTAGDVGTVISYQGTSLPLMVISWAQMGYLQIRNGKNGSILLEKKIDMGNERNAYEIRIFDTMFKKSPIVDTSKRSFAVLSQRVFNNRPSVSKHYIVNPRFLGFYRFLFLLVAFFGGLSLAQNIFISGIRMILWSVFFSLVCMYLGSVIQDGIACLFLHQKDKQLYGLAALLLLIAFGIRTNNLIVCILIVVSQIFAGFTGPYFGRKNKTGRQTVSELYGLRKHLSSLRKREYILMDNPEYFYQMIPFAIALGIDSSFSKCFLERNLPDCTFISLPNSKHLNSVQFTSMLKDTISAMDEKRKSLVFENFMRK